MARGRTLPFSVTVEVIESRCRSCDICIDLCPTDVFGVEPQLRKAVVTNLAACTGCRLCEWLCPDLAINVRIGSPAASRESGDDHH